MRSDREKLHDILEAIDRIERYAIQGRQAFEDSELIQSWFVQNLQVIGEAARSLSADTRSQNPEVQWSKIIGMRNVLTHNYFEIDLDIVWVAIVQDIPCLRLEIDSILQALS